MYFRFGFAVVLVVLISLGAIAVEKQSLELRREMSRQHYRMDLLTEQHARLRLRSQQLAGINRLIETIEKKGSELKPSDNAQMRPPQGADEARPPPLLFWQRPLFDPRLNEAP